MRTTTFLCLLAWTQALAAEQPAVTLARLSFWVSPQKMEEFKSVYYRELAPILKKQGLVESTQQGRPVPEGIFHRLFEFDSPVAFGEKRQALLADPSWQEMLKRLGSAFGTVRPDGLLLSEFSIYTTTLGPGTVSGEVQGQGHWLNFGREQGITNVWTMVEDRKGNLWFGTWGGLVRYDGQTFTRFTTADGLPSNQIYSSLEDRGGNLWFGTLKGVSRYDGEHFSNITVKDGLIADKIYNIFQDREGNLWFGSREGVSRYDGHEHVRFTTADGLPHNWVFAIAQDQQGGIWFATDGGGASRYDGKTFTNYTTVEGLTHNNIVSVQTDRDGSIWFGTYGGGLSHYDGQRFVNFTFKDWQNIIWDIHQDSRGNIWLGTIEGLIRIDAAARTAEKLEDWKVFTAADGLAGNWVLSILEDRHGNLWFGTADGISKYEYEEFTTFGEKEGLVAGDLVKSMIEDRRGDIWMATSHGVSRYDGHHFTNYKVADGLGANYLWSVYEDREGNLWLGTRSGGVSKHRDGKLVSYTVADGLASNSVWSIYQDRQQNMWFGTWGKGVSSYDGQSFRTYTVKDGLADGYVYAIFEDQNGDMWFGTNYGVSRFDGNGFTNYSAQEGLADNVVHCIFQDREGYIWIATNAGMSRYDGKNFRNFSTLEGLTGSWVFSVLQDRLGVLWFGGWGGISRYDGQVFQSLTKEDGLVLASTMRMLEARNGDIWMASFGSGVTRFRPKNTSPPAIAINAVVADRRYEGVSELSFSSPVELVTFEYRAQSFNTRPDAIVYRYRLAGLDKDWQTTRNRRIEYQNLPRGDYTFEIQAVDRDLNYSEPAQVRVTVYPPYERIGLISALVIALGLAGWQTRRVVRRDRALQRSNTALSSANEELEQKSKDLEKARVSAEAANHAKSLFLANMSHEIRTPMNAILGYAQILRRGGGLASGQQRAVETIQTSGDHLLKLINNVLDISKIEAGRMELKGEDFDLQSLVKTLGMMFELQCREKGLGWRLEGLEGKGLLVHGDEGKLRQILINLLGNAVKFTQAGEVGLRVSREGEQVYTFAVRDTGPGISASEQETIFQAFQQGTAGLRQGGTGLGLAISQRQLRLMDSQLQVESAVGKGSRFYFTVELPSAHSQVGVGMEGDWSRVKSLGPGRMVKALVADDVAENREILASMLGGVGVRVEVVENGQQALERLGVSLPDIVFLDIRMPVLDGLAAVRLIQEHAVWSQVKVIAISASVLDHERQGYLQAGFDDFIDKPFSFERICQCLAQQLRVEFEYGEEESARAEGEGGDWSGVVVPAALHARLREAAELYSVTELEGCFGELERLGEERLAGHLRGLRRRHDIEAILAVLQEVKHD